MAATSNIEWTDHTINFWTGCKKVSPGCKFCYMYRDFARWKKDPEFIQPVNYATIKATLKKCNPGDKIFICSWSDFFIEEADYIRDAAWDIIRNNNHVIWQILTKRPERIEKCLPNDWGNGWEHVWLGVSVEDQNYTSRIVRLLNVPAKVRFLSLEPLLGKINLEKIRWPEYGMPMHFINCLSGITESRVMDEDSFRTLGSMSTDSFGKIDWVIIGGESGNNTGKYQYRECLQEWIEEIIIQCQSNKVPVFVKQTGTWLSKILNLKSRHGKDIEEFPENIRKRQLPLF